MRSGKFQINLLNHSPPYALILMVASVAFSAWRLTLDLVEAGLERASIPSVRFDGKVPQKDRQRVVERFREDPTVRVMLLTLSCGSVG